jgi:hypothetical protein
MNEGLIRSQSTWGVMDFQLPSGIRRISEPLSVFLYLARKELVLDLPVETNPKSKPRSWMVRWLLLSSHSNSNGRKGEQTREGGLTVRRYVHGTPISC